MQYEDFIRTRITQLRIKRDISEYKMSLDLGHSKSYIQSISSGRALPSMTEFIAICEYLDITPRDFFDDTVDDPFLQENIISELKEMNEKDRRLLLELMHRFNKK
ncbi:MAG: helix-turn-helix transcriptional regulator [Oscillospiraceae bacterium]|nr:helix-turn-helix transcriptional regulator [Oscillospiraceae bacterium]